MTVKSVGLAPALTFNCSGSASVSPPFVRKNHERRIHRNSSTSIESHGRGWGVIQAAHVSGFRINFSKQFTPMMMTAQTQHNACGGRGQQIVSLSTSQRGKGGSNRGDDGFSEH